MIEMFALLNEWESAKMLFDSKHESELPVSFFILAREAKPWTIKALKLISVFVQRYVMAYSWNMLGTVFAVRSNYFNRFGRVQRIGGELM